MSNVNPSIIFKFQKIKASTSAKEIIIEGFANAAVVDRVKDNILPKGWKLDNFRKNGTVLFNHNHDMPVGKAVEITANDKGLWLKTRMSKSSHPDISKVRDLVDEGILNSYSVSFVPLEEEKDSTGVNVIKSAELLEVSIVSVPANQESQFSITSKDLRTKSLAELRSLLKGENVDPKKPDDKPNESGCKPPEEGKPKPKEEPAPPAEGDQEFNTEQLAGLVDVFNAEVEATEGELPEGNPPSWVGDEALWEKAKRASKQALGEISYAFVSWFYTNTLNGPKKSAEAGKTGQKGADQAGGDTTQIAPEKEIAAGETNMTDLQKTTNILLGSMITEIKSGFKAMADSLTRLSLQLARGEQGEPEKPAEPNPAPPASTPATGEAKALDEARRLQDNLSKRLQKLGV